MQRNKSHFLYGLNRAFNFLFLIRAVGLCIIYYFYEFSLVLILCLMSILFSVYSLMTFNNDTTYVKDTTYSKIGPYFIVHYVCMLFFWKNLNFYFLISISVLFFFTYFSTKKEIIRISILMFILFLTVPLISILLGTDKVSDIAFSRLTRSQLALLGYYEICFLFLMTVVHVYYLMFGRAAVVTSEVLPLREVELPKIDGQEKFGMIYSKIIESLEKDKLYKDPNLRISDLAREVGTNRSYASAALNRNGKTFNELVNFYRVQHAKQDLLKGKKTLKEVYVDAGFAYYSTFAKVFEEVEHVKHTFYYTKR